jgi:hypothetical protein
MNFRRIAAGSVLTVVLAVPAFAQSPDDPRQDGSNQSTTPGNGNASNASEGQSSEAQQAIMDVQSKLQDQGYFDSTVNGNWGPSSVAALQLYQEDHGLKPNGVMDKDTAASLGLSQAEFSAFEAAVGQQPDDQQPGDQGPEQQMPDIPQAPDQDPDEGSEGPDQPI